MPLKVTVYIVNYNCGRYLESAVISVLQQTYGNLDFFVIDNKSNDPVSLNTLNWCEQQGIKVYYRNDSNLIKACLFALSKSDADYIVRLDGDDLLLPNAIDLLVTNSENGKVDMVVPSYINVDQNLLPKNIIKKPLKSSSGVFSSFPAHGACTLLKQSSLLDAKPYLDEFSRQDGFMVWLKFNLKGFKIKSIPESAFLYRNYNTSLSSNKKKLLQTRLQISKRLLKVRPKLLFIIQVRPGEKFSEFKKLREYFHEYQLKIVLFTYDWDLNNHDWIDFSFKRSANSLYDSEKAMNEITFGVKEICENNSFLPDQIVHLNYLGINIPCDILEQAVLNLCHFKEYDSILLVKRINSITFRDLDTKKFVENSKEPELKEGTLSYEQSKVRFLKVHGVEIHTYDSLLTGHKKQRRIGPVECYEF